MTTTDLLTDMLLVESEKTATIHAPVERVDIADWVLHLPDAEYQRCCAPDHIAAGATTTDDGRPMSINVEVIGGSGNDPNWCSDARQQLGEFWKIFAVALRVRDRVGEVIAFVARHVVFADLV